jgi:hypothetical protein
MHCEIPDPNVLTANRSSARLLDSEFHVLRIPMTQHTDRCADRFWLRAMQTSCASSQERFIASFAEYAYAVIDEASDRAKGTVRTIKDYLRLTRLTAGPYPCFFPLEMDLDIPDDVMMHPSLEAIRGMTAESLVLGNVSAIRIFFPYEDGKV